MQNSPPELEFDAAYLEREWQVTVQTPRGGLDGVLGAGVRSLQRAKLLAARAAHIQTAVVCALA